MEDQESRLRPQAQPFLPKHDATPLCRSGGAPLLTFPENIAGRGNPAEDVPPPEYRHIFSPLVAQTANPAPHPSRPAYDPFLAFSDVAQPEEKGDVDLWKAAKEIIEDDDGTLFSDDPSTQPKLQDELGVIGRGARLPPSYEKTLGGVPPILQPVSTVTSTFVPSVTAKPWSPSTHWTLPPTTTVPSEQPPSDDLPTKALRVDMNYFFSAEEAKPKKHNLTFSKNETNFSLQMLQGVRANMQKPQPTAWYPVFFHSEDTFVPAPFVPEGGHPTPAAKLHFSVCHPPGHPKVKLNLYYYECFHCINSTLIGKADFRPPDLKLGGICGDVPPAWIAHLVESVSSMHILAIDVFGNNYGRCNLWLQDETLAPQLIEILDRRIWMSPIPHGYAVVVDDDESREFLHWYLEGLREHGPRRVRFPRHLVTCEKWIP